MKTPPEDHDLIRWLDGEMNPAERTRFAARMDADPALKAEAEAMQRISTDLRAHLPVEMPLPYADFFNSQIQVRIAQEEVLSHEPGHRTWLDWLRMPTLVAATAAVAIAGMIIWQQGAQGGSVVLSTYAPDPAVQARSFHSEEAGATVLMLDGLEDMPADKKFVTFRIKHTENDHEAATTTLYGLHDEPLLVVAKDARNQPRLLAATPRG